MKTIATLLFLNFITLQTSANVNYVDVSKITNDRNLIKDFNFIKDNTKYYDHWTNQWNYDIPKQNLVIQLRAYYKSFSSLDTKNEETLLFLGDIAHYLYNLDDTAYYTKAVINYNHAASSNPVDYRVYWFLGYHYALSNSSISAIDNFIKAEPLLPSAEPSDFWNDYAMAAAIANMPSHCIYAIDKTKCVLGKEESFQHQLWEAVHNRIVPVNKNDSYSKSDIWRVTKGDKIAFTSRPLGIKIEVDSTWGISINDYQKKQTAFILTPPAIASRKGKEVGYTIAIIMKTANDNDKLEDYINKLISKYPDKKQIPFSNKYEKTVAYEIKDKTMYQNLGGGHLYMIGIERNAPKYPGLLLENPEAIPEGNAGQINYYSTNESQGRFEGKIFYVLILDSCEDINEQSFSIFKSLFDNRLIIE